MPAIIALVLVLLVTGIILSARIRNSVFSALAGIADYAVGAWPTWRQIGQATRPIWLSILIFIGFLLGTWVLFFFIMWGAGTTINAPWSGFIIGLLFPIWCVLFLVRPFLGRLAAIPYWIATAVIIMAVPLFLLGVFSPDVKSSFDRWTVNKKGELANLMDKGSIHSEPEIGVVGFANENDVVVYNYNDRKTPIKRLRSGDAVMILSLEGDPVNEYSEGMVLVKLPNEYGDFKGKLNGWVVSRKISWKKPFKPIAPPPPPPPAAAAPPPQVVYVPTPIPQPQYQTVRFPGERHPQSQVRAQPDIIPVGRIWRVHFLDYPEIWAQFYRDGIVMLEGKWIDGRVIVRQFYGQGRIVAELEKVGPRALRGCWSPYMAPGYGEMVIQFLDQKSGRGEIIWRGVKVPFEITVV